MGKDEIINFNKFGQVILERGLHQLTTLLIVYNRITVRGNIFYLEKNSIKQELSFLCI